MKGHCTESRLGEKCEVDCERSCELYRQCRFFFLRFVNVLLNNVFGSICSAGCFN